MPQSTTFTYSYGSYLISLKFGMKILKFRLDHSVRTMLSLSRSHLEKASFFVRSTVVIFFFQMQVRTIGHQNG